MIANVIGEGNEKLGKAISAVAYIEGSLIGLIIGLLTYFYSTSISGLYTSNNDTKKMLSNVLETTSIAIVLLAQALAL